MVTEGTRQFVRLSDGGIPYAGSQEAHATSEGEALKRERGPP